MKGGGSPVGNGGNPPTSSGASGVFPLAALLFGPASVLELMSRNLIQVSFGDIVPALIGTLVLALLVWAAVVALRRRRDAASAVIACIWVVVILYHTEMFRLLNDALDGKYSMVRAFPFALAAAAILTLIAARLARFLGPVHAVLIGIAAVMLVTPTWKAVAYAWRNDNAQAAYDADAEAAAMPQIAAGSADGARSPDIYHFIFDRYASAEILERHFGIEERIGDFLTERGFYVVPDSHSNYLKTGHSLASTFYMDYLDVLADDPRVKADNWHPIFAMLDDTRVVRFLRARGYDFLQFGSWWVGTFSSPTADENHPLGFSEFNLQYLRRTMALPVSQLLPRANFTMRLDWDNGQCQRVARQIEQIKAIGARERDRPVYVFAHILVPHGPEVFTTDGRCLTNAEARKRGERQGYIDQIAYANNIIEDVVTALQEEGRPAPVILIQADEGPFPVRDYKVEWQDAPAEELRIKTGILNTFYIPGEDYHLLRDDITPVNSYRAVFDTIFGTDLGQLPDRIYTFPNDRRIYEFEDMTESILCEDLESPASLDRCPTVSGALVPAPH